eukprot:3008823-Pyramimonas_sp.AAC.1
MMWSWSGKSVPQPGHTQWHASSNFPPPAAFAASGDRKDPHITCILVPAPSFAASRPAAGPHPSSSGA